MINSGLCAFRCRRMGVSKVVLYRHKSLSTVARAVLLHYQKIGFVEVVPFDIPMTGEHCSDIYVIVYCMCLKLHSL